MTSEKLLYNIDELRAALGGIGRNTVYTLFKQNQFRKIKIGQNTYARVDEVKAYIDRLSEQADAANDNAKTAAQAMSR